MIAARLDVAEREAELADPLADREPGELRQAEGEDRGDERHDDQGKERPAQQLARGARLEPRLSNMPLRCGLRRVETPRRLPPPLFRPRRRPCRRHP